MSSHLWKAFYEDDPDAFQRYLELAASHASRHNAKAAHAASAGPVIGSPEYASSPTMSGRSRKANTPRTPGGGPMVLTKADINYRDPLGLTLLHHVASSTSENATAFAAALLEHPLVDLRIQDLENGWTALHRAFYFGNVTTARLILERDAGNIFGRSSNQTHQLVKIKDKEGLGPLDLFLATIKDRTLRPERTSRPRSGSVGSDEERVAAEGGEDKDSDEALSRIPFLEINGDQTFVWGSGNNNNLGLGDQDDRQFPERINIRRPDHLVRRFYEEHLQQHDQQWSLHDPWYSSKVADVLGTWIEDIPWVIRSRPLFVQDVVMSKLHTAVLTSDPCSNLYLCGHGKGGRLGTGDERTRFHFVCVEGGALTGRRIATIALGQNHTIALDDIGEIFSWGNNGFGQLGYSLPRTSIDEDPISTIPRQIFGPLKREKVIGVAASRIHSVAHSATSLFTFGKNEGQLGIVDSDARSLEIQTTPRKVAASLFTATISSVSAIDGATICLLENHDVWVFANYGYAKISFPLEGFSNYFLSQSFLVTSYDGIPNRIVKVTAEGDNICALSSRGEIFTVTISQRLDSQGSVSTTNPAKIRSAISQPQRIWSPKKDSMAARDVGLDVDGSVILATAEGSVWKRTKRTTMKDASSASMLEYKPKDYKFSRIPGLTRVLAVRSSGHGAYSAIRNDCDVLKTQIVVDDPSLWKDILPLLSLRDMTSGGRASDEDGTRPRLWQGNHNPNLVSSLKKEILGSSDIDSDLAALRTADGKYDAILATTSSEVKIPVHRFMLTARSRVLRKGLRNLCRTSTFTIPDLAQAELDEEGRVVLTFQSMDSLTILDLAMYLYTDSLVDFWHFVRSAPKMAYSYRQVRAELMKIATKLELGRLEPAVRQMVAPRPCLDMDLEVAFDDPSFFDDGDVLVHLEDDEVRVHSALVCARCPFFEGLFMGRASGRWIKDRQNADYVDVDMGHIQSRTFKLVLRHIYCDSGPELFDDIVSTDVDDFLDVVMDVLSCANELILDRLSQVAQSVAGRFVNARNVCGLLNAISPTSVHEFKDAGLEYICLNLEAMLHGHHLSELDPDLSEELDEVIRANQLTCMPFAKSGRAESLLHERHPGLAAAIDASRRRKIDSVILRSKFVDMATFTPGSFGEELSTSPMQQKGWRKLSNIHKPENERENRSLKAEASSKDMMFDMDEETESSLRMLQQSPSIRPMAAGSHSTALVEEQWYDRRGKALPSPKIVPQSTTPGSATPRTPVSPHLSGKTTPNPTKPWSSTPLATKADMRDIMAQDATRRTSTLTQGLADARSSSQEVPAPFSLPAPKMSQKDRKRMQQGQMQPSSSSTATLAVASESATKPFSWQAVSKQKLPSLKEDMAKEQAISIQKAGPRSSATPHLTMRQTVANSKPTSKPDRSASESKSQGFLTTQTGAKDIPSASSVPHISNSKPIAHSIRHQPIEEPILGLSMSEIVALQQAEKDVVREAVAKRDLQEIQAEQEFQEWWEKESARVQEAEQRATAASTTKPVRRARNRGGQHSGKGRKEKSNPNGERVTKVQGADTKAVGQ